MRVQHVSGHLPLAPRVPNEGLTDAWVTTQGEALFFFYFEAWPFILRIHITVQENTY